MTVNIGQRRMRQHLLLDTIELRIKIWLDVLRNFEGPRGMDYRIPVHPAVGYGSRAVWWMLQAKDLK